MTNWHHRHILDLATFSLEDFTSVLELANRFKSLTSKGTRKLPALQGKLVTTLFFEASTRTKSSFELRMLSEKCAVKLVCWFRRTYAKRARFQT